jgi:hypothetical protein
VGITIAATIADGSLDYIVKTDNAKIRAANAARDSVRTLPEGVFMAVFTKDRTAKTDAPKQIDATRTQCEASMETLDKLENTAQGKDF